MNKICVLKAKLHKARVSHKDLNYEGSIEIDKSLLLKAGIKDYERVEIANITNGLRWETYTIPAEKGSGTIAVNGGGARLCEVGDQLVIMAYVYIDEDKEHSPTVIRLDSINNVVDC
jgi:aspartate 1-decarboxylase